MKSVLLIGATGFIGRNFREYAIKNTDYQLICPSSKELDCTDDVSVEGFLKDHYYDAVLHFGNYSAFNHQDRTADRELELNLRSYELFATYSDSYGRMFYAGSGAEYDKRKNLINVCEEDIGKTIPADIYGLYKYIIGQRIESSKNAYNLRLFGIYGKYEYYPSKFISGICAKAVKGIPFTIRQNVYFDYLWVDDFIRMLVLMIEKETLRYHTYNMTSGKRISLLEICEIVSKISGNRERPTVYKEGLAKEYTASNKRFLEEFPDFEFTDHERAISELYHYFLEHEQSIDADKLGV